jgi:hypothetical protein
MVAAINLAFENVYVMSRLVSLSLHISVNSSSPKYIVAVNFIGGGNHRPTASH